MTEAYGFNQLSESELFEVDGGGILTNILSSIVPVLSGIGSLFGGLSLLPAAPGGGDEEAPASTPSLLPSLPVLNTSNILGSIVSGISRLFGGLFSF